MSIPKINVYYLFHNKRRDKQIMIGSRCPYCNKVLTKKNASVDHVIPKSEPDYTRNHETFNTMYCCRQCNSSKQSQSVLEFLGFLKKL